MSVATSWRYPEIASSYPEIASLAGRDFLTLADLTSAEIWGLLAVTRDLKARHKTRRDPALLKGVVAGLLFRKPSTRTRVSFEAGILQLGGHSLFLTDRDLQLSRGESIRDTAAVLSSYLDLLVVRTFAHAEVEELAHYATIPVINALTDRFHPCQALADVFTIWEEKGDLRGVTLAYLGDGNNVAHSLLMAGAKLGMKVRVASPPGYAPDAQIVEAARAAAGATGGSVEVLEDPREAAFGADCLYTDVWTSMGQEAEAEQRRRAFLPYQLNDELLKLARPGALVLHCLPAHYGEEITPSVAYSPQSAIFTQAENRLHVQKAIMAALLSGTGEA